MKVQRKIIADCDVQIKVETPMVTFFSTSSL